VHLGHRAALGSARARVGARQYASAAPRTLCLAREAGPLLVLCAGDSSMLLKVSRARLGSAVHAERLNATQRSASSVDCRPLGRTWLHAARARLVARATASPPPARRRQEYLAASGVPYTALLPCCFFDNYAKTFVFQPQPDGSRTWSDNLGTAPLLMHAVADIGQSAARAHRWPLLPGVLIAICVPRCSTLAQRPHRGRRPAPGSARLAALIPPERLY